MDTFETVYFELVMQIIFCFNNVKKYLLSNHKTKGRRAFFHFKIACSREEFC